MNWEVTSTLAEIIGAVGVIGSLLFLGFETRNNTKTVRSSLSNEVLTATAELNDVILADPELRETVSKATNPEYALSDFNDRERNVVVYLARALFMRLEGVYMLYRQGLVERDVWEGRLAMGAGLIQLPVWALYWNDEQNNSIYTRDFVEVMNSASGVKIRTPITNGTTESST